MAASNLDKFLKAARKLSGNLDGSGIINGTVDNFGLSSAAGLPTSTAVEITIDRVDSNGTKTPSKEEVIRGVVSGDRITSAVRGVEGTAQAHLAGAVWEIRLTADQWNRLIDGILAEHNQDGSHKIVTIDEQSSAPATPASGKLAIYAKNDSKLYFKNDGGQESEVGSAKFWMDIPVAVTRVSDTQFTIPDVGNANKYDLLFKKLVILRWLEGSTFQTAMIESSSYATDVVTINIVGDTLGSDFASMKYCMQLADVETFIIPGTLPNAAMTDLSKAWIVPEDVYILGAKPYVRVAGTTNATTFDINDDGTTKFTNKLSIASGATSGVNQVADNPSTLVAKDSVITIDMDSVSTTQPQEAYIYIYHYPVSLRYRN